MAIRLFVLYSTTIVFCNITICLPANGDANDLRTLDDYLNYALLHSAELRARFEEWKMALEQVPQARSLDDPKFTYSYFLEEVETKVGPQKEKFGIMQVFPWFGKLEARAGSAMAKAEAAKKRYDAARLKLFREVKQVFYDYTYLASAISIAKDNLELLKHFEEIARIRYKTAITTHPDTIRAQIELAKLENILQSLEQLREPIVARAAAVLNRPSGGDLDWPEKHPPVRPKLNHDQIIDLLIANNPQLASLNWEITAARNRLSLAEKKFYPDIGIGIDWIDTEKSDATGVKDNGKDPVILMFTLNIPLWHDSYKAARRQADAAVRKAIEERKAAENDAIAKAIKVLYDIEDSQRTMDLYEGVLIPKARQSVRTSEAAYRAGTIDFPSLIDAQRTLLTYELEYEQSVTVNQQKLAELEMLTGVELANR